MEYYYFAGRASRLNEIRAYSNKLMVEVDRSVVQSYWLAHDEQSLDNARSGNGPQDMKELARIDLSEIQRVDTFVCFNDEPSTGKDIQLGIAIALALRVVLIGPRTSHMHHLPNIEHFDNFEAFLEFEKSNGDV